MSVYAGKITNKKPSFIIVRVQTWWRHIIYVKAKPECFVLPFQPVALTLHVRMRETVFADSNNDNKIRHTYMKKLW